MRQLPQHKHLILKRQNKVRKNNSNEKVKSLLADVEINDCAVIHTPQRRQERRPKNNCGCFMFDSEYF
jgi:anti-sigma factor ChrR (cupin superfamily)